MTATVKAKEQLDFELLPHLPHTHARTHTRTHIPNLTSSDYHMFEPQKVSSVDKDFVTVDEISDALRTWLSYNRRLSLQMGSESLGIDK